MRTRNRLAQLLVSSALLLATTASAQVTIGSNDAPNDGALLDLKEEQKDDGSANSKHGLGMPRVTLTDLKKLQPMYSYADDDNKPSVLEKESHTGLAVYHVASESIKECAVIPDGIYVWDGEEWLSILEKPQGGLILSPDTLTFYNTMPKDLSVSWRPSETTIAPPTYTVPSGYSFTPATGTWTTGITSPQTISIKPLNALVPFAAATTTTVNFKFDFCDNQIRPLTIEHISKVLQIKAENDIAYTSRPSQVYATASGDKFYSIKSNSIWKLASIIVPNGITPAVTSNFVNTAQGVESQDGSAPNEVINQEYSVQIGAGFSRYNYLKFSDTRVPKRFGDVVLSVNQCGGSDKEISMVQYKELWEDMYGLIDGVDEPNSNGNADANVNSVQWHYDQNGNIFFSAKFGNDRWMTTNLAATGYDTDSPIKPELKWSYSNSSNPDFKEAYYGYPGGVNGADGFNRATDDTKYKNRPRLGLLYNWGAATGNETTNQKQGICPNGWHLPSDTEWDALVSELTANPQKYSDNPTGSNTAITVKDMCENTLYSGKSFSFLDGGFSVLLAGYAFGTQSDIYGVTAYFMSSTKHPTIQAGLWDREVRFNNDAIVRSYPGRYALLSVRCKKNIP